MNRNVIRHAILYIWYDISYLFIYSFSLRLFNDALSESDYILSRSNAIFWVYTLKKMEDTTIMFTSGDGRKKTLGHIGTHFRNSVGRVFNIKKYNCHDNHSPGQRSKLIPLQHEKCLFKLTRSVLKWLTVYRWNYLTVLVGLR
jgi:hypothetical protein